MRYFDDGDLTEGLAVATKPYPMDLVLGYWHAVSTCYAGERTTVDYDDPSSPTLFRLQLESLDGRAARGNGKVKGKHRQHQDEAAHDDLMVTLTFRDWHLEYTGIYNMSGPATTLYLSSNETPDVGDVDKEATLAFGTVLDDRGYPFLRISLSACEAESGDDDMQPIEIISKKTDTTEVHKLELSKNERLRLGYAVRADGHFEDIVGMGEPTDSYESLTRQLSEHTAASARIAQQLTVVRARMDEQLREAAESGKQIRSIYNEHRLSLPSRGPSTSSRPPQPVAPPTVPIQKPVTSAPRPTTAPRPLKINNQPAAGSKRTYDRVNGAAYSTPTNSSKGKRYCQFCDKSVSLSHGAWDKHRLSRRHQELSKLSASAPAKASNARDQPSGTPRAGLSTRRTSGVGAGAGPSNDTMNPRTAPLPPRRSHDIRGLPDDTTPEFSDAAETDRNFSEDEDHEDHEDHESLPSPSSRLATTIRIGGDGAGSATRKRRRRQSGSTGKGPTQLCTACDCHISIKNWNVHTKSNKHRINSGLMDPIENGVHHPPLGAGAGASTGQAGGAPATASVPTAPTSSSAATGAFGAGQASVPTAAMFTAANVVANKEPQTAEDRHGTPYSLPDDMDDEPVNGNPRLVKRARIVGRMGES